MHFYFKHFCLEKKRQFPGGDLNLRPMALSRPNWANQWFCCPLSSQKVSHWANQWFCWWYPHVVSVSVRGFPTVRGHLCTTSSCHTARDHLLLLYICYFVCLCIYIRFCWLCVPFMQLHPDLGLCQNDSLGNVKNLRLVVEVRTQTRDNTTPPLVKCIKIGPWSVVDAHYYFNNSFNSISIH